MANELNEQEAAFIRAFVRPDRQEMFAHQMASSKRRRFLDRLNHRFLSDLDPKCVKKLHDYSGKVLALPNPLCYVIADESKYDGRTVSAREAFEILVGAYFGLVVSFIPGKLACYKDEEPCTTLVWLVREK